MNNAYAPHRKMTVARRALIVQRVLVDGWASAEVAAAFGVSECQVDVWVADFRRSGMTSLRRAPRKTLTVEILRFGIGRPIRGAARVIANGFRRLFVHQRLPQPLPLRRLKDDRRGGE
jgi:leucine-zipper of insertion element IS481